MVRLFSQYFAKWLFVLLATETVLIFCSIWRAVCISLSGPGLLPFTFDILFGKSLIIAFACLACLYYDDTYDLRSIGSMKHLAVQGLKAFGARRSSSPRKASGNSPRVGSSAHKKRDEKEAS